MTMKSLVFLTALAACGGGSSTGTGPANPEPTNTAKDTHTPFEQRLSTACMNVAKKLTACAVSDTDAKLASGEITQKDHDDLESSKYTNALTEKSFDQCNQPEKRSSRQVRVLEVCLKQEQDCAPLLDCLDHMNKKD
ncbi:MAG TPA: hypothetical protein VGM39_13410 [Kofleriaceae bacterium]|jgi:hypothetical protein